MASEDDILQYNVTVVSVENVQCCNTKEKQSVTKISPTEQPSNETSGNQNNEDNYSTDPQPDSDTQQKDGYSSADVEYLTARAGCSRAKDDKPPATVGSPTHDVGYLSAEVINPAANVDYPKANAGGLEAKDEGASALTVYDGYPTVNIGKPLANDGTQLTAGAYPKNKRQAKPAKPRTRAAATQATTTQRQNRPVSGPPNDYICYSIVVCFFCFWPLGVIALYYAIKCRDAIDAGRMAEARSKSRTAMILAHISLGIGIAIIVTFIILISIVLTTGIPK